MASVNKVIVLGNLGADPELRYTQGGSPVCNMRIATNERWRDKDGAQQERTEWHQIVVWGKQAENCEKYLKKGRSAYVEGRLQTRDWEDKDGNKRYTTEIVAQTVQFMSNRGDDDGGGYSGGGGGGGGYSGGGGGGGNRGGSNNNNNSSNNDSGGGYDQSFEDDDIPF